MKWTPGDAAGLTGTHACAGGTPSRSSAVRSRVRSAGARQRRGGASADGSPRTAAAPQELRQNAEVPPASLPDLSHPSNAEGETPDTLKACPCPLHPSARAESLPRAISTVRELLGASYPVLAGHGQRSRPLVIPKLQSSNSMSLTKVRPTCEVDHDGHGMDDTSTLWL